jgi:hypothetical protein
MHFACLGNRCVTLDVGGLVSFDTNCTALLVQIVVLGGSIVFARVFGTSVLHLLVFSALDHIVGCGVCFCIRIYLYSTPSMLILIPVCCFCLAIPSKNRFSIYSSKTVTCPNINSSGVFRCGNSSQ